MYEKGEDGWMERNEYEVDGSKKEWNKERKVKWKCMRKGMEYGQIKERNNGRKRL